MSFARGALVLSVRVLSLVISGLVAHAHTDPKDFTDPVALLRAVARIYARGVDTFHMELVAEVTSTADLRHEWRRVCQTAIKVH